jgi:L-aspartate oxidase
MAKDGSDNVFLDVTHLQDAKIAARFPTIYRTCLSHGIDMAKDWIPVSPAAHYMMGGIVTNTWGETTVPGLFSCGETACTGVHGANRLASNSLLEVLIFGKRLIQKTKSILENKEEMDGIPTTGGSSLSTHSSTGSNVPPLSLSSIQNLMWEQVGMVRNGDDLEKASKTLALWEKGLGNELGSKDQELRNVILTARLMAEAALQRTESRGAHSRSDFDATSKEWEKHLNFQASPS